MSGTRSTPFFAADAVARLTGVPGVAAVTAGPGVTNTLTAVKNAQMAQSPVILLGGAAATAVQGRGALQDIEQLDLFKSVVKWSKSVRRVKDIVPTMERAFREATSGTPGPVFVELPIDTLYDESIVKSFYDVPAGKSLASKAVRRYLDWHVNRLFSGGQDQRVGSKIDRNPPVLDKGKINQVAQKLLAAEKPVILVGAQTVLDTERATALAEAVEKIGAPVFLSSMARGLLGKNHPLQMRHKRRNALKEADVIILAGVPCDFRLDYGNHIPRRAFYISSNLSKTDLTKNRRPEIGLLGDPGLFLRELAAKMPAGERWTDWLATLRDRHETRQTEIENMGLAPTQFINPLTLCQELERQTDRETILVADGGDFVGTASYIVQPPGSSDLARPWPVWDVGRWSWVCLGR